MQMMSGLSHIHFRLFPIEIKKRKGPKTLSCGTPDWTLVGVEYCSCATDCVLSVRKNLIDA